jgi:GlpG protein
LLIAATAFVGNTAQYWQLGYNNFGGMSGVIYGLVGFVWTLSNCLPNSGLLISTKMFIAFVVGLVLMEIFASSSIATAAHIGGLLSGLLLGVIFAVYYRFFRKTDLLGRQITAGRKNRDA